MRNVPCLEPFYSTKTIIVTRQARDKHSNTRKVEKKEGRRFSLQAPLRRPPKLRLQPRSSIQPVRKTAFQCATLYYLVA